MTSISSSLFNTQGWLSDALSAIENSSQGAGIMGALQNAKRTPGSIKTMLYNNALASNALSTIAQGRVQEATTIAIQQSLAVAQKRTAEKLQAALNPLTSGPAPLKKLLDPFIYFANGSKLDTEHDILTRTDGVQIDTKTGKVHVDESSLIRMANGAYLDTQNNILTLADGTKIDTVTHLTITA